MCVSVAKDAAAAAAGDDDKIVNSSSSLSTGTSWSTLSNTSTRHVPIAAAAAAGPNGAGDVVRHQPAADAKRPLKSSVNNTPATGVSSTYCLKVYKMLQKKTSFSARR